MPVTRPCLKCFLHVERGIPIEGYSYDRERSVLFHYGRERGVLIEDVDKTQMLLLSLLNGQHSFEEIVALLQDQSPDVTAEDISETLDELTRLSLLDDVAVQPPADLTPGDLERYESQMHFLSILDTTGTQKYAFQSKLKNARVAVIGLGGVGCNVLLGLAAIGIGFLRGVDFDIVETGNLNRQVLYDMADLGKPKALAAADQLARFNPSVTFEAVQRKIERTQDLLDLIADVDLVAFCADRPNNIQLWMNEAAVATGTPFIVGGYHGISAEAGPFVIPGETACLKCFSREADEVALGKIPEFSWAEDGCWLHHPNIHFLTALDANLICGDICKYFTGISQPSTYNHRYTLDIEQFTLTPYTCSRYTDCIACGQSQPAHSSPLSELQRA